MDAPETKRGTKLGDVAAALRDAIGRARIAPGQRLVEADLTASLGVSRSLLREAFRQLAAEGLIEMIPNRGAIVRRLTMREATELFQIRAELEALAGRLAAARMSDPAARASFEAAVAPIWNDAPRYSTASYIAENQAFHSAIFCASGNVQLAELNDRLQLTLIMSQIGSELSAEVMTTSVDEHRAIARAILAGQGAEAADLLRSHLERATVLMASMPPEVFRA